jgi:hypothetical protein
MHASPEKVPFDACVVDAELAQIEGDQTGPTGSRRSVSQVLCRS